jgi:hypothetical protein
MAPKLHENSFLKNLKVAFESFKKIRIKNLDIDTYEIYYSAKNQSKTLYFSLNKNNKSVKISNFETIHCSLDLDLCIYHFWWAQNIMIFGLRFFTLVDPIIINIKIFVLIFLSF